MKTLRTQVDIVYHKFIIDAKSETFRRMILFDGRCVVSLSVEA